MTELTTAAEKIQAAQADLEKDLRNALHSRIERFKAETGLQVTYASVSMDSVDIVTKKKPVYTVGSVSVSLDI